jgi:hypothetical protein
LLTFFAISTLASVAPGIVVQKNGLRIEKVLDPNNKKRHEKISKSQKNQRYD